MSTSFQSNRTSNATNNNQNGKRKRNHHTGMIVENSLLPLRILDCQEGQPTQYGTGTLRFSFQHLISKEEFNSTVFENSAPNYIDLKIVDAVLPPEEEEYGLDDLVDRGLFAQVKFRTKGENTYINVVEVAVLDEKYNEILANLLAKKNKSVKHKMKN